MCVHEDYVCAGIWMKILHHSPAFFFRRAWKTKLGGWKVFRQNIFYWFSWARLQMLLLCFHICCCFGMAKFISERKQKIKNLWKQISLWIFSKREKHMRPPHFALLARMLEFPLRIKTWLNLRMIKYFFCCLARRLLWNGVNVFRKWWQAVGGGWGSSWAVAAASLLFLTTQHLLIITSFGDITFLYASAREWANVSMEHLRFSWKRENSRLIPPPQLSLISSSSYPRGFFVSSKIK